VEGILDSGIESSSTLIKQNVNSSCDTLNHLSINILSSIGFI